MPLWLANPHILWFVLTTTTLLHLILSTITPLTVDEAHYALYGLYPDLSYFDHPPLIGWLQYFALYLGQHEVILRLFPIALYALTAVLLHRFTLSLFNEMKIANLTLLLFAFMPMSFVLGMALVPETLLLPLSIALIWQAQRTLASPIWSNWLILGILIGLSGLSKYTALLMAIGLLFVLVFSSDRHWLLSIRFWTSVSIALAMVSPILIWNAQHDWISFNYQLNHGNPQETWHIQHLLQSQIGQLLIYTPLIWFGAWMATFSIRHIKTHQSFRVVWLFILPGILIFTLSSGKEPSLPHWLLFFYLLWLPWLAQWLYEPAYQKKKRYFLGFNYVYSLLLLSTMMVLLIYPAIGNHFKINPAQDLLGWKDAAQQAKQIIQEDTTENKVILTTHWVDSSRIAWYASPIPVLVLDQRYDQFDIWFGSPQMHQSGLLILAPDNKKNWLEQFESCKLAKETDMGFRLFHCSNWKSKP